MTRIDDRAVADRLNELIQEKRIRSVRAFALSIDADPSFFNKVLKCERSIPESMVKGLEEKYSVRPEWLLFGQSPKYGQFVPHETHSKGLPENETITVQFSELISLFKATQAEIIAEKEARRQDAENWLKKESEEKKLLFERNDRLLNVIESSLGSLKKGQNQIFESQKVSAAYQLFWLDKWAEKEVGGPNQKARQLAKAYRKEVAERLKKEKGGDNSLSPDNSSNEKHGQHR